MIPSVIGLPLEEARAALDEAGVELQSVEHASPPDGAGHPPRPNVELDVFVASQRETSQGKIRLKVVSVPRLDVDGNIGDLAAKTFLESPDGRGC